MSEGLNRCTVMGNLGNDPDLRFTQGGTSVLNMSVAATTRYKDQDGEWKDRTEWVRVVVWGKRAEALGKLLGKGSRVYVEGELRTSSWEDKEGTKRYKTEVHASQVLLCGDAKGGQDRDRDDDRRETRGRDRDDDRGRSRGRDDDRRPRRDERARDDRSRGRDDDRRQDDDIPF